MSRHVYKRWFLTEEVILSTTNVVPDEVYGSDKTLAGVLRSPMAKATRRKLIRLFYAQKSPG